MTIMARTQPINREKLYVYSINLTELKILLEGFPSPSALA